MYPCGLTVFGRGLAYWGLPARHPCVIWLCGMGGGGDCPVYSVHITIRLSVELLPLFYLLANHWKFKVKKWTRPSSQGARSWESQK